MLLKPIQRSKSWDTVLSTTTEHEGKEKKKLTKVDSAGVNERRSDDAVVELPNFKHHDFNITHPGDSTSTTKVGCFFTDRQGKNLNLEIKNNNAKQPLQI